MPRQLWPAALVAVLSACQSERAPAAVPVIDVGRAPSTPLASSAPVDPSLELEMKRPPTDEAIAHLPCSDERKLRSLVSEGSLFIDFANAGTQPISLYWIDFAGARVHYADVSPGDSYTQQTYVTHPWVAVGPSGTCLGIIVPKREDAHEVVVFGRSR